jgi:aspartyl-tRNA(Asn)/glutamyl-tRNA(Gln) amidotransferase subunit C
MAAINIDHLCTLASLALSDEERNLVRGDLENIIAMIDQMQSLPTEGVQPMANPLDMHQRLRDDVVTEHAERELLQRTTPHVHGGYYIVPRFVE